MSAGERGGVVFPLFVGVMLLLSLVNAGVGITPRTTCQPVTRAPESLSKVPSLLLETFGTDFSLLYERLLRRIELTGDKAAPSN